MKFLRREIKIITGMKTGQCRMTIDFFHKVINPGMHSGVLTDSSTICISKPVCPEMLLGQEI
jgi:hypothetical protein